MGSAAAGPPLTVAIDGPAGSGKSTAARRLAARLGFTYVDTGAMYRAVAWLARARGIALDDEPALAELAGQLAFAFPPDPTNPAPDAPPRVVVNGQDLTAQIRRPEMAEAASLVSTLPRVRERLVAQQRQLAAAGNAVLDGRDIGTVVFPRAEVKFFLTAPFEVRLARRAAELAAQGLAVDREWLRRDMASRDERDRTRAHAPLVPAPDAVVIDTGALTIDQVVGRMLERVEAVRRARQAGAGRPAGDKP
ncbi:MAG TPA: (d)CMP kinase [Thermodesulfobacteriota bacterium]|nr:(d)CMP kinase [Thermodesulfobacteriota bacterium]